jgi:hypothetical protein
MVGIVFHLEVMPFALQGSFKLRKVKAAKYSRKCFKRFLRGRKKCDRFHLGSGSTDSTMSDDVRRCPPTMSEPVSSAGLDPTEMVVKFKFRSGLTAGGRF